MLELNRAYTERTYTRGFCFSDGLEEETGFVWDGIHLFQEVSSDGRYTYPDSYEPLHRYTIGPTW